MSEATKPSPKGSDWTRLLTDPDLVSHLGKLLQTYREVSPDDREPALLRAMRETAGAVPAGKALEIGLWVTSGKIWVKGVIISGVATRSAPTFGVRVKFSEAELSEKEHLREFLKFVESTSRKSQYGKAYVAQLKR